MLGTKIVSDLVRHPSGLIFRKLVAIDRASVCLSVIVTSELKFGIAKNTSIRLAANLLETLSGLIILPFEPPMDQMYAQLRAHLKRLGTPIGPNDLLIASHALTLDLTLVTDNDREFSRVPGLKVENWLRAPD